MRFDVERLEPRLLLAAKVRSNDTTVFIKGDGADDDIEIVGTGDPGSFEVFVEGVSFGEFHGIDDIRIKLGGGDNVVVIDGVILKHGIRYDGGNGDDDFSMDDCNVQFLRVKLKGGDDILALAGNTIHRDTNISGGGGDDDLAFDDNAFLDDVRVDAGGGDDFVSFDGNTFVQRLFVKMGGGIDDCTIDGNEHGDDVRADGGGGKEDSLTSDRPGILRKAKNFEFLSD